MTIATTAATGPFERYRAEDVRQLVADYPLAWVCGGEAGAVEASLLPLVGRYDADGALVELIGHLARANPLHDALRADPRATILFSGPQAYISPEYIRDTAGYPRNWAPTWNYIQARVGAVIGFDDTLTEPALDLLIDAMEQHRAAPWRPAELGARYECMLRHIVGFRARVTSVSARFKLGQDERPETFNSIVAALPHPAIVRWMQRFDEIK